MKKIGGTKVVSGDVDGLSRFPTRTAAPTHTPQASMQPNSRLESWGSNQVPENKELTEYYKNPRGNTGEKKTIEDSMDNGGKIETRMGKPNGVAQHITGHLGTHKI